MPKKNLSNCLSKFSKCFSAISVVFDLGFYARFHHKFPTFFLSSIWTCKCELKVFPKQKFCLSFPEEVLGIHRYPQIHNRWLSKQCWVVVDCGDCLVLSYYLTGVVCSSRDVWIVSVVPVETGLSCGADLGDEMLSGTISPTRQNMSRLVY